MSTLSDLVERYGYLEPHQVEWLHLLVGDWQLISDLAFADLVLWLPTDDGNFVALAQCRPSTGATVHYDDIVGTMAPDTVRSQLEKALVEESIQRSREPRWFGTYAVREEAVPVNCHGHTIAVVARQTNLGAGRTPSRMEMNYVEAADDLMTMIAASEFPHPDAATGSRRGAPRVGDGLLRLNAEGDVLYASPNALSCFHRLGVLGPLVGQSLVEVTADLIEHKVPVDESMPLVMMGRAPWRTDIESKGVCLSVRAVPLMENHERIGAVLMCRDVSELRRRERELITKDATIREIHHRVKNNLQTVAALLRLQARRMTVPEAREALEEAMRRVSTIALVHDSLSQTLDEEVEFDVMVGRALRLAADVASAGVSVRTIQRGEFGLIPAQTATPLALVLTELVTNAVEHGLSGQTGGTVEIRAERTGQHLRVDVLDDGMGLGDSGSPSSGLGTTIVRTLVSNELQGDIEWAPRDLGGTRVTITCDLL
ncbi:sensor histidine kinase [Jonesia denitrificans]|uniref:histidine kinase n=1 Tax=Jonesia denitrificans (strain ATCC 14870 / DSM 20603 / BCRC 15368 / CIP 55.134 / JCM 11481 / NBRC 15587 / NCTC 10816 / Prevot 55134) TaxID=471856 RepID=C7QZW9_JONDD|nr:PAS domain-containing sensor histidine kinase [Jonesia denitrificans]ACV09527.1 signal transduction histidine kinase [Jonesia denitrificans DSM 20603]ASE09243.1 ATPase [Jonesia denitrificans]QXB43782.1 PAS domain-containing sensor histidine kinase [Jonesia denitrificans]SQH21916.1 Probable sensor histidine kinase pdtaS [Jonesia denitrificans]